MMAKLLSHRQTPIPSLAEARSDVPDGVESLFRRMVAKSPEDRYPTVAEVIADLDRLRAGQIPVAATMLPTDDETMAGFPTLHDFASMAASATPKRRGLLASLDDGGRRIVWTIVAAGAAGAAILAGIIVSMQTRDGTVVVEVDQPDAEVRVLDEKGKVEVSRKGGEGIVTIGVDPGKHRLVVEKDGFEAYGEEFILSSGGRREIAARLVPLAAGRPADAPAREPAAPAMKDDAPPASDGADAGSADRRAAEWAMQHGAEVVISTASGRKTLASG